jgi:hypothetical protein
MGLVVGLPLVVARQGRRECPYREGTGATEDAASRRAALPRRHRTYFVKPS